MWTTRMILLSTWTSWVILLSQHGSNNDLLNPINCILLMSTTIWDRQLWGCDEMFVSNVKVRMWTHKLHDVKSHSSCGCLDWNKTLCLNKLWEHIIYGSSYAITFYNIMYYIFIKAIPTSLHLCYWSRPSYTILVVNIYPHIHPFSAINLKKDNQKRFIIKG